MRPRRLGAIDVACPECGAKAGELCDVGVGTRWPHSPRAELARAALPISDELADSMLEASR